MALKLPDSAVPMGDFPVAKAVDIDFDDGENLQEKLDNGALGGDNSTHKTVIFENNIDMGKYLLLAKITGANYSNNIIKFSCPNYKGVNDAGFKYQDDMDIYKFELHFNTGSMRETNSYGVTLKQHGLGLYSYPLSNPKNTEPRLEEAIRLYWDYSKGEIYVFLVDIMTAIPHCVLEYTGSGTLLRENTFVMDDLYNRRDGLNGTWENSKWSSIPFNKLEIPPIHELGGDGGSTEGVKTYTSLSDLGLTAPVTVGEIYNAMIDNSVTLLDCDDIADHVTDVPMSCGVLTIKKKNSNRFSIDYQNSLGGNVVNVKRWIATLQGLDGRGLTWKLLSTNATYTTLSDMGLTADATVQDAIDALPVGSVALLRTDAFTNWSTLFMGIQYGYLKIEKTINNLSNIELQEVLTPNRRYFGSQASGKFAKWIYDRAKVTASINSKTFKIDITKGKESWNGNMKFGFVVDNSYGEITISSLGATKVSWSCSEGLRYVKSVTYTIDPDNKAHVTIGVELYEIVYGTHHLEIAGDFATINSLTGDAFTGTSVAERWGVRGKNNGVGILCEVEDLGLTFPCTTVQIAQAMSSLTKAVARIPISGMIGIFDNAGNKITDAPTQYGLLQINAYGYDRVMIRYEGIGGTNYSGSWIGRIQGNNGTFSGITWSRLDLETRVNELFQSVSDGKTLVANAITGKGVSTATDATFATMATNIGKISGGYKEETKSLIVTSNSTGTEALPFTFSANVIAVKRIVAPSDSCRIVPQTSKDMFTITGKELIVHVTGTGTWKVTALIEK